jgi:hypothetical protein
VWAVLGFIFYFIGAGMVWHELIEQTPENFLYEGTFNSANYYVYSLLFPVFLPFILLILIKGKWVYNYTTLWFAAFVYAGLGMGGIFSIGHQEPPAQGRYSWVSHSAPSINAVRIAWEEGGRSCVGELDAKIACNAAKNEYNSAGFVRNPQLKALGLNDFYMVLGDEIKYPELDGEREDVQIGLAGLVILLIVGWSTYIAMGGSSMQKGGFPAMPFAGTTGENSQVGADGEWTKSFANNTFLSMIGFGFALVATFVLWTSDAAADPTHPFYETVLGMAIGTFMVANTIFIGVTMEDSLFLEFGLFMLGFTVFAAPQRMWQMAALAETPIVEDMLGGRISYSQDVAREAEIDRYYIGGVLSIISAVIGIYTGSSALAAASGSAEEEAPVAGTGMLAKGYQAFISLGSIVSFVGIFVAVGILWKTSEDILGEIDANNSDRGNAANYYIFTILFAYFGFFINTTLVDSAPGAAAIVKPFKSLNYVSMGLCTAMWAGFSAIGTHDRQLWMIDGSLGGINELRALLAHGSVKNFEGARSFGVTEEQYVTVLSAVVIMAISMSIIFTATIKMPFSYTGSDDVSKNFANIKTRTGKIAIIFALIGAACWIIGFVSLLSLDIAAPPVHKAEGMRNIVGAEACVGKHFNMHFLGANGESPCAAFENGFNPEGERYTLNLLNSGDYTEAATARYTQIFTFSAITMIVMMANLQGTLGGSLSTVKVGLFLTVFGLLGLSFALSWNTDLESQLNGESTTDQLCRRGNGNNDDEEECRTFKNGFVFYWLQSLCVMISGATSVAAVWYESEALGAKIAKGDKAKKSGFCGGCCTCCKPTAYTAEEPAAAAEAEEGKQSRLTDV